MQKTLMLLGCAGTLMLPSLARAQEVPLSPIGSFSVTPYLGLGFQSEYHDAVVEFDDGDRELLRLEPGTGIVIGVQAGYRVGSSLTAQANLSYSAPAAEYVEDNEVRPSVDVKTILFELGVLHDLSTFPVGANVASFLVGGGLSLTFHSFDPFQWDDVFIEPSSTSFGVHGLAALDIPLASKLTFRGQVKLTVTSLALGDLNDKIALAEGNLIVNPLDGGIGTYLVLSAGVTIRP